MLKHGIWLCVLGSFALHVLILIFLTRTMSASQVHMKNVMETFIIDPLSVPMRAARQPLHNVDRVITERQALITERPLSDQVHNLPQSTTGHDMHPDNSRKSNIPAFEPVTVATGTVETVNLTKTAPGSLAVSHFLSGSAESKSTVTFPHGTEISGDMSLGESGAPYFIHKEPPIYPFIARKLGKEGNVVLRLTLDEKGGQKEIEIVVKGGFGFTEAAVQAVKKSILSPAQKDGKPVFSRVLIPVRFVLRND